MSITVVFAVRLVVLLVVGDKIIQIEAIMSGNEIDARPRLSAPLIE